MCATQQGKLYERCGKGQYDNMFPIPKPPAPVFGRPYLDHSSLQLPRKEIGNKVKLRKGGHVAYSIRENPSM